MLLSKAQPLARCRVLVVEDEYFVADEMALALRALGAEIVGPVPTRDQALRIVESAERIHAAILDINLRGESVFPVADILGERGIPFVFATGYDETAIPATYRDLPRWEKPFDPASLARALPSVTLPC
jgi:CheY-like chemotaxis protein